MQNVLVSPDKQVFSRLAITEVQDSNKSFTACLNQYLRSVILMCSHELLLPPSLPSLLQIHNLKQDPILGLGIRKQRKILTCDPGRHPSVLGSEQPGTPGKEI